MNGVGAYMPEPEAEPEEIYVTFDIAEFQIKFSVPKGFNYSVDNLTEIKNLYISPYFVKVSQRLSREFRDSIEIYIVKVSEGSLSIRGRIRATVKMATDLSSNAFTAGVLASALTIGATSAMEQNNNETLYYDTIQKIELILEEEAKSLEFCPNPLEVSKSPFYSPVLQKYEMVEYTFCPTNREHLVEKIEKTLENYHNKIDKI